MDLLHFFKNGILNSLLHTLKKGFIRAIYNYSSTPLIGPEGHILNQVFHGIREKCSHSFFFPSPKLHLQLFHPLPSKVIKETDQKSCNLKFMYHKKNIFYLWVEKGGKSKLLTTDHSKGACIKHLSLERRMAVLPWDENKGEVRKKKVAKSPKKPIMLPSSQNISVCLWAQGFKEIRECLKKIKLQI